jgi:excisionase family DNA binding protein
VKPSRDILAVVVKPPAGDSPEGDQMFSRLLTKAEVAELFHVSIRTVDRLRASGLLPTTKVRGAVRFSEHDIRAFVEAQRRA